MHITEQMQTSDIWRIDPAAVPTSPVKPRKLLNAATAGVLSVFVGVGMAFIMEFADTLMKSAEEVEAVLGLPILGAIPRNVGPGVESVTEHPAYHRARSNQRDKSKPRE
ncbi:MAG: GNVR domain-containing protein [Clostridia bacterium]|nr:GNVR domain-containing protein [Clostridia bacterium]